MMPLKVQLPDEGYHRGLISCQVACPVHTDARGYVRAIAEGRFEEAYLIARGPNPFASICGRICGAPCEAACRRGQVPRIDDDGHAVRHFINNHLSAIAQPLGSVLDGTGIRYLELAVRALVYNAERHRR